MTTEIPKVNSLEERVFNITNDKQFVEIALEIYNYQYNNNLIYKDYCNQIKRTPITVQTIEQLPFLPISFFKSHDVKTGEWLPEITFTSSGTTSHNTSKHQVKDLLIYENSFLLQFEAVYGKVDELCIIGLLPSYLEREGSSLVYMVNKLVKLSNQPSSGFYLYDHESLRDNLLQLEKHRQKTILFGVTYALLDFASTYSFPLVHTTIIETGGLKGRKEEITRDELYIQLKQAFNLSTIDAEYGMTELLSQAYGKDGQYTCAPWMKVLFRDETDPLSLKEEGGVINIIDLANVHSCSFIATDDLGKKASKDSFSILGRVDNADIRGCSLLIT